MPVGEHTEHVLRAMSCQSTKKGRFFQAVGLMTEPTDPPAVGLHIQYKTTDHPPALSKKQSPSQHAQYLIPNT